MAIEPMAKAVAEMMNHIDALKAQFHITLFDKDKSIYQEVKSNLDYLNEWDETKLQDWLIKLTKTKEHLEGFTQAAPEKTEAVYPGNVKFSAFKNLIKINNAEGKNEIYFSFDPEMIVDYHKANDDEKRSFEEVANKARFCAGNAQNGIKVLSGQHKPKCKISLGNKTWASEFTHELKIHGAARIGLIQLEPEKGTGPQILLATNYIKNGFHNVNARQKEYSSLAFFHNTQTFATSAAKFGLFGKATSIPNSKLTTNKISEKPSSLCLTVA